MPITFRDAEHTIETTNVAVFTTLKPGGVQANDVLLAGLHIDGPQTITPPTGWDSVQKINSGTAFLEVFVKVAGDSEPTDYSFGLSDDKQGILGIAAYAGCDPSNPVDVSEQSTSGGGALELVMPSLITTVDGAMLVFFGSFDTDISVEFPVSMAEMWDGSGGARGGAAAYELLGASGPTGTRAATLSSAPSDKSTVGVALAPAGETGDITLDTVEFSFSPGPGLGAFLGLETITLTYEALTGTLSTELDRDLAPISFAYVPDTGLLRLASFVPSARERMLDLQPSTQLTTIQR